MKKLTAYQRRCLESIVSKAQPAQEYNPGVVALFLRRGLADVEQRQSPYSSHKQGQKVSYLVATDAGKAAVSVPA